MRADMNPDEDTPMPSSAPPAMKPSTPSMPMRSSQPPLDAGVPAVDARPAADDVASATDARAPAVPTPDAAPVMIGGDPRPCPFQLCESFESYADGAKPDPAIWRSGGVAVDSTRAARGKKALKVVATYGESWYIRETKTFPAPNGAFYGRLFYWVDQQPTTPQIHWTMIEASDQPGGGGKVLRYGGFYMLNPSREVYWFNIETRGQGETGTGDFNTPIPLKTWHCVEWYFDTPKSEAHLWHDGQARPKLDWANSRPTQPQYTFPELKSLSIGWGTYQKPDAPFVVWIDEIAIDGARVGCDR